MTLVRWMLMGIGLVSVIVCGVVIVLGLVVVAEEWLQPWDKRGKG